MKKFTKILAVLMAAVLLVGVSVSLTVAYLTAEADDKLNEFTVGDISIDLDENVGTEGAADVVPGQNGAEFSNVMPGDTLKKEVYVTNTGSNPAYVAVTVTLNNALEINKAIDEYYEALGYTDAQIQAIYDRVFDGWGIRYDKADAEGNALGMRLTNQLPTDETLLRVDSAKTIDVDKDVYFYAYANWFQTDAEKANTAYGRYPAATGYYPVGNEKLEIDPMGDYELRYTYYLYLEGGETYTLFDGLNVPVEFDREQLKMFEGLKIKAEAAAIQADNTVSAKNAFAVLAGDVQANVFAPTSGEELAETLSNLPNGATVVLENTVDYGTVAISGKLTNVTIDAQDAHVYFTVPAGAQLDNVTFTNMSGDGLARAIAIANGSEAKITVTNSTFADNSASPYGALYTANPNAQITITDCDFINCKYAVYGSTPAKGLTITDCYFENVTSWAVLLNGGDSVGAELTISGCTFENCTGGIAKYLGGTQPEGASTVFTNNTLTNCKGHDGSDAKWFTIPGAAQTVTVSGNTLDGAEWVPGAAQGLGK